MSNVLQDFESKVKEIRNNGGTRNDTIRLERQLFNDRIMPKVVADGRKQGLSEEQISANVAQVQGRFRELTTPTLENYNFISKSGEQRSQTALAKDRRTDQAIQKAADTGSKLPILKETIRSTGETLGNAFGQGSGRMLEGIARFANDIGENEQGTTLDNIANFGADTAKRYERNASNIQRQSQSGELGIGAKLGTGAIQSVPMMALPFGAAKGGASLLAKFGASPKWAARGGLLTGLAAGHTQNYGEVRRGSMNYLERDFPTWESLQGNQDYEKNFEQALNQGLGLDQARHTARQKTLDDRSERYSDVYGTAMTALDVVLPSEAAYAVSRNLPIAKTRLGRALTGTDISSGLVRRELAQQAPRTGLAKLVPDMSWAANRAGLAVVGKEAVQEGLQGGIGEYGSQKASADIGGRPIDYKQIGQQMLEEGAIGGIMGGGMRFAAASPSAQAQNVAENIRNQTANFYQLEAQARQELANAVASGNEESIAESQQKLADVQAQAVNIKSMYDRYNVDAPPIIQSLVDRTQVDNPGASYDVPQDSMRERQQKENARFFDEHGFNAPRPPISTDLTGLSNRGTDSRADRQQANAQFFDTFGFGAPQAIIDHNKVSLFNTNTPAPVIDQNRIDGIDQPVIQSEKPTISNIVAKHRYADQERVLNDILTDIDSGNIDVAQQKIVDAQSQGYDVNHVVMRLQHNNLDGKSLEEYYQDRAKAKEQEQTTLVTLPNGEQVNLVYDKAEYEGDYSEVKAFNEDGELLGSLGFLDIEEENGDRYNPQIYVDEQHRRKGVASALYDFAESNGAKIPELNAEAGAVRTLQGQAFREAREARKNGQQPQQKDVPDFDLDWEIEGFKNAIDDAKQDYDRLVYQQGKEFTDNRIFELEKELARLTAQKKANVILGSDGKNKWFSTYERAKTFINKKNIADTHHVVQTDVKHFEIQPISELKNQNNSNSQIEDSAVQIEQKILMQEGDIGIKGQSDKPFKNENAANLHLKRNGLTDSYDVVRLGKEANFVLRPKQQVQQQLNFNTESLYQGLKGEFGHARTLQEDGGLIQIKSNNGKTYDVRLTEGYIKITGDNLDQNVEITDSESTIQKVADILNDQPVSASVIQDAGSSQKKTKAAKNALDVQIGDRIAVPEKEDVHGNKIPAITYTVDGITGDNLSLLLDNGTHTVESAKLLKQRYSDLKITKADGLNDEVRGRPIFGDSDYTLDHAKEDLDNLRGELNGQRIQDKILADQVDLFENIVNQFENSSNTGSKSTVEAESEQSSNGQTDSSGKSAVRAGRSAAQQPNARTDQTVLDAEQSGDGKTPEQSESPGRSGIRGSRADVESEQTVPESRDVGNGREGAGRERTPDAGRGKTTTDVTSDSAVKVTSQDFHLDNPLEIVGGTPVQRFDKNRKALELLDELETEGRQATPEEQKILAGYIGWGSFGQDLFQGTWDKPVYRDEKSWKERSQWLRERLGEQAWKSAQRSITNAHYTDPHTVTAMWDMLSRMGVDGGRILEPAMGTGNFFSMMPLDIKQRSQLTGIELDITTGAIAKQLFPNSNIQIMGYQKSKTPDNFYDVVVSNFPFENTPVADRKYNKLNPMLHDYFFMKAIDQVRPGGIVMSITSAGTMDKKGETIRRELAKSAELIASIRLPSGAFKEYAGTDVVTDIIVLRKRPEKLATVPKDANWISTVEVNTPSGTPVKVNQYYADNPHNILGTLDFGHGTTTFRAGMVVHRPDNMLERLQSAVNLVPENALLHRNTVDHLTYYANKTGERHGSLSVVDGQLMLVMGDQLVQANEHTKYEVKDSKKTAEREQGLKDIIALRKLYNTLIDAERGGQEANAERKALFKSYQDYTKKYGSLRDSFALSYLERVDDPYFVEIAALENDDGTPATVLKKSTIRGNISLDNPSISDAYIIARNQSISPNLEQIAKIANKPQADVKSELVANGAVFETPTGDIVPSDLYLSGNVREKLREAQDALDAGHVSMEKNVNALKEVMPTDIPYFNIETKMGAAWIPVQAYKQYVAHMLNQDTVEGINIYFKSGRWKVALDKGLKNLTEAYSNFGSPHIRFDRLVQAAMSNQTLRLTSQDAKGNSVFDPQKSEEANASIAKIREEFSGWLWSDAERKIQMEHEYNESMNAWATPKYDGSFMTMQGMALTLGNGTFNLRQHQLNAIWRAIANRRSMNAHEVGTGKTFTMGGIAVESRRYGIAQKPLILAHNANSASVAAEIRMMYPNARVLYISELSPKVRSLRLRQIANDDWDVVVMPHSMIDRLTLNEDTLMAMAADDIAALEEEFYAAAQDDNVDTSKVDLDNEETFKHIRSVTAKELAKARKTIIENIQKQAQQSSRADAVPFENLGVDMILVDEVQEFKKPPIVTRMRMKGLNTQTSQRSIALQFLTRYVRSMNNGGNVHTFTGTYITNTITEIYHQMRYVMEEEMNKSNVADWDSWFGSFATEIQDVELTASGEYEMVTRLAGFVNVPELRRMVGQFMDTVFAEDMPEMKPRKTKSGKVLTDLSLTEAERAELLNGRTENAVDRPYKKVINESSEMTDAQKQLFSHLQKLSKEWRNADAKQRRQWMIEGDEHSPIIVEGKANKASLDIRLNDESLAGMEGRTTDDPQSKPSRVVKNVIEIYKSHPHANQVIFTDAGFNTSVQRSMRSGNGDKTKYTQKVFSTVNDIVERLVQQGIPRNQIAIVTGSTSKEKRREIANAMNKSTIRVVIGSTDTLGVGVNMQRNLRAMHHMDAPYMPGDLEQRNGRGLRQANQWNSVLEYRYMTDRLDGRRWQILAVKQRFITAFMKANSNVRVIEGEAAADEQSDILESFSEAAGDPRILQRVKLRKKLEGLQRKERLYTKGIADMQRSIRYEQKFLEETQAKIDEVVDSRLVENIQNLLSSQQDNFTATVGVKTYTSRKDVTDAIEEYIDKNVRMNTAQHQFATYAGHPLSVQWTKLSDAPIFTLRAFGRDFDGHGIRSIEAKMRNARKYHEADIENAKTTQSTIENLTNAVKQPFGQAQDLEKVEQQLDDLETDLSINPVPPPAWSRQGAPIDSEVFYKGKSFIVTGHRYGTDNWYVVAEDEKGALLIPYMDAKDSAGMDVYEQREFIPPEVNSVSSNESITIQNNEEIKRIVDSEPANLTDLQSTQIHTPAFKTWFGDWQGNPENASKVVDGNGKPLVMYHGTNRANEDGEAFTVFDTYGSKYGLMGMGAYFTADKDIAQSYTKKEKGSTPKVYEVFLNIKNPLDMDAVADVEAWKKAFTDIEDYHEGGDTNESWFRAAEDKLKDDYIPSYEGAEIMQSKIQSMGFDGITHIGGGRVAKDGDQHKVYIVFDPEQIKSATDNEGAFDSNNSDIRYSRRDDIEFIHDVLNEITEHDELFRYPVSQKTSLPAIFKDVVGDDVQYVGEVTAADERQESTADHKYLYRTHSKDFYIYERNSGEIWIDVSRLDEGDGGSSVYAAVGNYAHNTNKSFIGDPAGLSEAAVVRRTNAMLSLALRYGTTDFIEASPEQIKGDSDKGITPLNWTGNDVEKIRSLIDTLLQTTFNQFPELDGYRYDFRSGKFFDRHGRSIESSRFQAIDHRTNPKAKRSRIGEKTARRIIFLQSLASSESGERSGILEQIIRRGKSLAQSPELIESFSKNEGMPKTGHTSHQVRKNLVERFGEDRIAKLEQQGILEIVDTTPRHIKEQSIEGFYHDGKVTLIADALTDDTIIPTFLHELGGHGGFQNLLKPQTYQNLIDTFNRMVEAGNPIALEAKRLAERESDSNTQQAEYLPYLLTVAAKDQQGTHVQKGAIQRFIDRIVAAVKAWVVDKLGVNLNLNADDMVALAERMVRQITQGGIKPVQNSDNKALYSRAGIRDSFNKVSQIAFGQSILLNAERTRLMPKKLTSFFNTMLHKALTDESGQFKRTFDLVQEKINHITYDSGASMQVAPDLLTQMEDWGDYWKEAKRVGSQLGQSLNLTKSQYLQDINVVSEQIYSDNMSDNPKVRSAAELSRFGFTPSQIEVYKQVRDAVDTSLDSFAKTTISKIYLHAGATHDQILDLTRKDLSLFKHRDEVIKGINYIASQDPDKVGLADEAVTNIDNVLEKLDNLKAQGYMPMMRFGKYWMRLIDKSTGEVALRKHFESEAERNRYVANFNKNNPSIPDNEIEIGTINELQNKVFTGVSPETVALFAKEAGLPTDGIQEEFIKLALRDNHALKRMLKRYKIEGFDTDLKRVLASFVMSNARYGANQLYNGAIDESVLAIEDGQLAEDATRLREYALDPKEEVAGIKNFAFVWYMGASLMFGLVNLTQPVLQTFPHLLQYSGNKGLVFKALGQAVRSMKSGHPIPPEYKNYYEQAKREGHLDPQNTWMLQGLERGKSGIGASTWQLISHASGFFAQASETINRRTTLFAALEVAKGLGQKRLEQLGFKDNYDFAIRSIQETQGIYNKGNRPRLSRGNVGSLLMMYKQFMIAYLEQMVRMQRSGLWGGQDDEFKRKMAKLVGFGVSRSVLVMLGILWSFSGARGLPFFRDILDALETVGGVVGKPFNSEREIQIALRTALGDTVGETTTNILLDGVINTNPVIDVQGRMGMGDLVPGSAYFSPTTSEYQKSKELSSIGGAVGGLLEKANNAMEFANIGSYGQAIGQLAPKFATSGYQGVSATITGEYRNPATGYKTSDATIYEGLVKSLDAQPSRIAKEGRIRGLEMRDRAAQQYINLRWKQRFESALAIGDRDKVSQIRKEIADYNEANPRYPITFQQKRAETTFNRQNQTWQEKRKNTTGLEWMNGLNDYLSKAE